MAEESEFCYCPNCGCDEALITSRGANGVIAFCPGCCTWNKIIAIECPERSDFCKLCTSGDTCNGILIDCVHALIPTPAYRRRDP